MKLQAYMPTEGAINATTESGKMEYTIVLICPKLTSKELSTIINAFDNGKHHFSIDIDIPEITTS